MGRLRKTLERFVEVLSWVDGCFIADETLEDLPGSAWVGKSRVGGIDLNQPRMRAVAEAVGRSASGLYRFAVGRGGSGPAAKPTTGPRRATYDLKKLRAKQLVRRVERTRRYEATPDGVRALTARVVLRDK